MSNPQTTPPARRSPLWMRVLLGISLALNLAVVGIAVGTGLRLFGAGGMPPSPSIGSAMIRALPSEDRREVARSARQHLGAQRERRPDVTELIAALKAEPYEPDAVRAQLVAQTEGRQRWIDAIQTAWLEQVNGMSNAERQDFAERLEDVWVRRGSQTENR